MLKSVTANGTDVTDTGIDHQSERAGLRDRSDAHLEVNEVTGTVTAGAEPATDYTVVIFSEDAEKWTAPMTRHVAFARPNQQGRYPGSSICRPGSYYAIAVPYIAQGDWNDPEVLGRLKTNATRVTLTEGESKRSTSSCPGTNRHSPLRLLFEERRRGVLVLLFAPAPSCARRNTRC